MQPEEGVDLEQYVKPVAKKKEKPAWLKKGAKVAMPLLFTAGALMTGQGIARAEGPNELQTPTPMATKGPEKSPTPTRQEVIDARATAIAGGARATETAKPTSTPVSIETPGAVVTATPISVNGPDGSPPRPGSPDRPPRQGGTPLHEVILNAASYLILPAILAGLAYAGYKIVRRLLAEGWNRTVGKALFKISSPPFVPEEERLKLEKARLHNELLKQRLEEKQRANVSPPPAPPTP